MSQCFSPRKVTPGLPIGLAPAGRTACAVPLGFPPMRAGETLDYGVDFSAKLQGSVDIEIQLFTVSLTPGGASAPQVSEQSVNGAEAVFYLGGGVAGVAYTVTVSATTPSGLQLFADIGLRIVSNEG